MLVPAPPCKDAFGITQVSMKPLLEKHSSDLPHPSALVSHLSQRCSLGFLGNEQSPAESPTPPGLCYGSCQVLNVAVVVMVMTTSHFGFN